MAYADLRQFLARLAEEGQLVRITEEVLPEPDIRAIGRAAADIGETGPAVIVDNIKGYKGKKVVLNVHGSWTNHALMFNLPANTSIKDQFYKIETRWDNYPGDLIWTENAPCQENIITENINLYEILPLFRINKNDGGFYFSKASVISKDIDDPDNIDKLNVGTYRVQVQGPDTLGMQALVFHDLATHLRKAEERNQPLPVAVCLGVDPVLSFAASTPLAYDQSEYKFAAALNGIPLELTKCVTCDLDVPAGTEYVIEGEILPRERYPEGPFGEFPGSYSGVRNQVRIKVKAVTHRNDPIFENLYIGKSWTEHDTIVGLNTSIPLYRQLKDTIPEVTAVNAMYQHGLTAIVATGNRFGGYAKSVAFRLASTPHGISYCKNIILVDADVDPFNMAQVMWALSTRVRPSKDVIVIANTPGMPLDPASEPPGMGGKVIIDATTPVAPDETLREVHMLEKVDKAAYYQEMINNLQKQVR